MIHLNIKKRDFRFKNHELRTNQMIPGVIYGPTVENEAIMLGQSELLKACEMKGEIYEVKSKGRNILVKMDELQKEPLTGTPIHFSLVQLPKGVENEVDIPIFFQDSPVGVKNGGTFVVIRDSIKVKGTPKNIPNTIKCSTRKLDIGDKITVEDLKTPKSVEIVENKESVVAFCQAPTKETVPSSIEEEPGELSSTEVI